MTYIPILLFKKVGGCIRTGGMLYPKTHCLPCGFISNLIFLSTDLEVLSFQKENQKWHFIFNMFYLIHELLLKFCEIFFKWLASFKNEWEPAQISFHDNCTHIFSWWLILYCRNSIPSSPLTNMEGMIFPFLLKSRHPSCWLLSLAAKFMQAYSRHHLWS